MQRRTALKSLGLTLGSLVGLPAWASNWTPDSIGPVVGVSAADQSLLADIVETLIPETTTPGARSLNVHQFVLRMIADCYPATAKTTLEQGLALTSATAQQTYGKAFADCDATQRKAVLTALLNDPVGKSFVGLVKPLTIQGYTSSEYYMVNVQKYTMAPGYYHGCVPVRNLATNGGR